MQKGNAPAECHRAVKISLVFPGRSVYFRNPVGTEWAMELFRAEMVAVVESETDKDCPSCGSQVEVVRTMVSPSTGCIVHRFECKSDSALGPIRRPRVQPVSTGL